MRRTNKDILLGYVATLTDEQCKEVYYLIGDVTTPVDDKVDFGDGIKLTQTHYTRFMWMWGEDKFKKCIEILREWVKKKQPKFIVAPYHLNGWVENVYFQRYGLDKKSQRKNKIDTMAKARAYIRTIPKELWVSDREVKFLVDKFGTKILQ